MKTKHIKERMMQRKISEKIIDLIKNFGEWNSRGDRIVFARNHIKERIRKIRSDLELLENLEKRGGATLVTDSNTEITVFFNRKRIEL